MGKKVMVIDDSRIARVQVKNALTTAGYDIVEAADGAEGVARIDEHGDLALVICDVNMPGMSGIDVLNAVKGRRAELPFIMLTTEGHADLVGEARRLGAIAWILKPFKPAFLLATVLRIAG